MAKHKKVCSALGEAVKPVLFPRLWALAVVLLLALFLSACVGGSTDAAPELLVPVSAQLRLDTAIASYGPVAEVSRRTGIVRITSEPVNFGAVSAFFDAFYVRPGDEVVYGQLLARLDMTNLEEQITRQEEHIEQLRRDFAFENSLAAIDIEIQALTGSAASARLELELARERQALNLRHLEADLEALKARYTQSQLFAPFDGTVTHVSHHGFGAWVAPFETVIYIAPVGAQVFVEYVGGSPFGHGMTVRTQAHINGNVYDATRIGVTREQSFRYERFPMRFILDTDVQPPIGARASLHIYTAWVEDALRVPRNSLFFNPDMGFYAYRVENGQRELVLLTVGIRTETYAEIISGLEEGDEVYVRS